MLQQSEADKSLVFTSYFSKPFFTREKHMKSIHAHKTLVSLKGRPEQFPSLQHCIVGACWCLLKHKSASLNIIEYKDNTMYKA